MSLYFEVFLLITFLENSKGLKKEASTKNNDVEALPSVSIIVPCYNEEETIGKTITSLLNLKYPDDNLHIVVVNDGSTDDSLRVLQEFRKHPQVTILHKENGGKHTALNYALQYIKTELVGCLDADSFVDEHALLEIIPYFRNKEVMAVTPAIRVHNPNTVIGYIQRAEYQLSIFIRRTFAFLDGLIVTPGPFSIFRRIVFVKLGGYRKAYNTEDLEIALRMQNNHYKIENAHKAFVYTVAPETIRTLFRQRLRWTYGFIKNTVDYKHFYFSRRYGNLGLFILPIATISIFSVLYFTAIFLMSVTGGRFRHSFMRQIFLTAQKPDI